MSASVEPAKIIRVFCSFADEDQRLQKKLEKALMSLERQGKVFIWDKYKVQPGQESRREIENQLKEADLILLLISPDFIASNDCYGVELARARKRQTDGKARIAYIHLRPCVWNGLPFSKLQALPRNGKPVTRWTNPDEAFKQIVQEIETIVQEIRQYGHGFIEPLQMKQTSSIRTEEERIPTTTPRANATKRRSRASGRTAQRTLQDIRGVATHARYPRPLPKKQTIPTGNRTLSLFKFIGENLSYKAFTKRCKKYSAVLLFLFAILDVALLPFAVYLWMHSLILLGAIFCFSLALFIMGVSNTDNAIGVPIAFIYFLSWMVVNIEFVMGYFNLRWSLLTFVVFIAIIPSLRLVLFLKRK